MTFVLSRFCIGHLFFWTWKRHSFSYPLNTSKLIFIAILQITETDSKGKILIFLRRKSAIFCDFLWFSFSTQFFSDHKSELFKKRWQLHLDNEYSWKNRFNRFHATLNGKLYLLYSLCIYIYLCLSYIHWLYYRWISLFSSDLNLFSENAAIIKELSTWVTIAPPSTLDVKDYTNSCPNLYTSCIIILLVSVLGVEVGHFKIPVYIKTATVCKTCFTNRTANILVCFVLGSNTYHICVSYRIDT